MGCLEHAGYPGHVKGASLGVAEGSVRDRAKRDSGPGRTPTRQSSYNRTSSLPQALVISALRQTLRLSLFRRPVPSRDSGKGEAMSNEWLRAGRSRTGACRCALTTPVVCAWVVGVTSFAGHGAHRYPPLEAHCGRTKRVIL